LIIRLNSEVSVLSPVSSPRVLDNPERRALGVVITDQQDSVIRARVGAILIGITISDDSAGVAHEESSIEGDGQRTMGDHVGDDVSGISVESGPVGDGGYGRISAGAGALFSSVWIIGFSGETLVCDDVFVGQPWKTSSASTVAKIGLGLQASVGTVDDPLFREGRNWAVSSQEPLSFNVFSSREGPARSTLLLILNSAHCVFGSPIEGGGNLDSFDLCHSVIWPQASISGIKASHQILLLEFRGSHVRKFVDAKSGKRVRLVQISEVLQVVLEVAQSLVVLSNVLVCLAVISNVLLELSLLNGARTRELPSKGTYAEGQNYYDD